LEATSNAQSIASEIEKCELLNSNYLVENVAKATADGIVVALSGEVGQGAVQHAFVPLPIDGIAHLGHVPSWAAL
jgi:hypothetical protein